MREKKYWDKKVPVYTEIKELREQRKEQYLTEAEKYYNITQHITNKEYREMVAEILKGNEDVRMKLMEISISPIIDALAGVYAKFDIEEYIPFEEGLSCVLDKFNKSLKSFKDFPKYWSEYSVSTINFYTFNTITFFYQYTKYNTDMVDYMSPSDLIWQADKLEKESFPYKDITIVEVRERLIKVMSNLDTRMARVLALRYGLFDGCERSFEEISKLEQVSRSRVKLLVIQALRRIRKSKNIKLLETYSDKDLDLIH